MTDTGRLVKLDKSNCGLAWSFKVNPASCGRAGHYEEYIRFCAMTDEVSGKGTTHVYIDEIDGNEVMLGFITLRATSYIIESDGVVKGDAALEVTELAVREGYERRGLGSMLIKFALTMATALNCNIVGVRYVVLCADEKAVDFYKKFGFGLISEHGEIPRDGWNDECVPMFLKLPELTEEERAMFVI